MVGMRVGIGKVATNTLPMCTNQDIVSISKIDLQQWNLNYLIKCIGSFKAYFKSQARGATIQGIKVDVLKDIIIAKPSIVEQHKIATVLDKVSEILTLRKRQLTELDNLVKSRFIEMFGKQHPSWSTKKLDELVDVKSSKRVYQREQTMYGVPFFRVSDLVNRVNGNPDQPELFISEEMYEDFVANGLVPTVNDILIASRGTLGLCYIVQERDKFYFQDGMISWLKMREDMPINPTFLAYLFSTDSIVEQISRASAGTTVNYLSLRNLAKLDIVTPPLSLQNRFADFVRQTDKAKSAIQKSLGETQLLFDSLMSRYFD
jgi:type I restriction enzyme S subunit